MDDPRLKDAREKDIVAVSRELRCNNLRLINGEWTGGCPICGDGGKGAKSDRFNISVAKKIFMCRKCDIGGDVIALVRFVLSCNLNAALTWLCGDRQTETPEQKDKRLKREQESEAARQVEQDRTEAMQRNLRLSARRDARRVWDAGMLPENTVVRGYLTRRGIAPNLLPFLPDCLRLHPSLSLLVATAGKGKQALHRGPAMLSAVTGPKGGFIGVQRTWIDLDQPKGKVKLVHEGEAVDVKMSLGSVMTGAIRLWTPASFDTLVMAEGTETTLSALVAALSSGPDYWLSGAAFWAGVSLGNMSGKMVKIPGVKSSGLPMMDDDHCFVPPLQVRRLVFVMDGDSDPIWTEAKCLSGLRRAMKLRPGLTANLLRAPQGYDLNDLVMPVAV